MKLKQPLDDDELVKFIKAKSNAGVAINQLYQQHFGLLENYVLQNSGNSDDAADIIQEVMLVFVQMVTKDKYRGDSSIKSMLYSICKNLWISEIRKRKSMSLRHEKYENQRDQVAPGAIEAIARQENLNYIMSTFQELGDTCRKILTLFYYESLPMKEICEELDFSSEQVLRNKKYKCLKSLMQRIKASPQVYNQLLTALRHEA